MRRRGDQLRGTGGLWLQRGRHRAIRRGPIRVGNALLNWGAVAIVVAGALFYRNHERTQLRAPLQAPTVTLSKGVAGKWRRFPRFDDSVPVLLYHGINDSGEYLSVPQTLFAQQMLALHLGGFHAIDMATYVRYRQGLMPLPTNPVMITFDDGEVSSYRGADAILAEYGFKATMFVVPDWIQTNPDWALQWNELQAMSATGRWDIQEHAGRGHRHVTIDAAGDTGEYYAYRRYLPGGDDSVGHLESFKAYRERVTQDILWGRTQLMNHLPSYEPLAFAVPYSNYGQRTTNDERIPPFFLSLLDREFPVVVDGDYLDTGLGRPFEQKARFSPRLLYRIQQGPIMSAEELYCRLHAFVMDVPRQREYGCANGHQARRDRPHHLWTNARLDLSPYGGYEDAPRPAAKTMR